METCYFRAVEFNGEDKGIEEFFTYLEAVLTQALARWCTFSIRIIAAAVVL